jgi:hypothetical protein
MDTRYVGHEYSHNTQIYFSFIFRAQTKAVGKREKPKDKETTTNTSTIRDTFRLKTSEFVNK